MIIAMELCSIRPIASSTELHQAGGRQSLAEEIICVISLLEEERSISTMAHLTLLILPRVRGMNPTTTIGQRIINIYISGALTNESTSCLNMEWNLFIMTWNNVVKNPAGQE